jgi:outer membrane protein
MKKLVLFFSLALLSFSSFAQSKVGTIDAEYIISQMPEMTQVNDGLKLYNTELQTDLESSIAEYEKLVNTYKEENATLTDEDRQTKEGEIISLENDIKGFRQKASVMMQMKRNELTEPLYEKINAAMVEVINEEGYTQILHAGSNALAFSAEDNDITGKVIAKLGITVQQ